MTQQPHKSMSRSRHALNLLRHKLTNAAKHLHPCMLVNQLQHMTPFKRFGFLLLWYASSHGNSYLVCTSNGSTYCRTWRHLHECSVKAADTVPSGTTVTLQALSSHCFLVAQPASPPTCTMHAAHICCTCNTGNPDQTGSSLFLPHQLFRRMPQPPKSVTSHATPVQPWRSGHACMAPRCLIQEI